MARLRVVVPVALVVTFGLLFNAFRKLSLAVLVLLNVPFALVGGAIGLWAMDMPVSIAAAVSVARGFGGTILVPVNSFAVRRPSPLRSRVMKSAYRVRSHSKSPICPS